MRYHPFRQVRLKLLSTAIAVLLWLIVSGEPRVERHLRVPLEFQNMPDRLELVGEQFLTVDVRAQGPSTALARLAPGDLIAVLDLRSARPGRRVFHLAPEQVRAPSDVEVGQVTPAMVALVFEVSRARVVPVVPSIEGEPASGYLVRRIASEPATVEVVGPESAIERLTEAITEPVAVTGASAPVRESVAIGVLDPAIRLTTPSRATVTVDIAAQVEHTIQSVPVHLRDVTGPLAAQAVPSVVAIVARGSGRTPADLGASIHAYVELKGLGPGRYTLRVRVEATPGVEVVRIDPADVQVTVKRE